MRIGIKIVRGDGHGRYMAASAVVVMMAVYFIAMRWRKKSAVAPAP